MATTSDGTQDIPCCTYSSHPLGPCGKCPACKRRERGALYLRDMANAMHLRDVAMNGLGAWVGEDLQAYYTVVGDARRAETPVHFCEFVVNGRVFQMTVQEIK